MALTSKRAELLLLSDVPSLEVEVDRSIRTSLGMIILPTTAASRTPFPGVDVCLLALRTSSCWVGQGGHCQPGVDGSYFLKLHGGSPSAVIEIEANT